MSSIEVLLILLYSNYFVISVVKLKAILAFIQQLSRNESNILYLAVEFQFKLKTLLQMQKLCYNYISLQLRESSD